MKLGILCFDQAMEERVEERDAEEYRSPGIFIQALLWKMSHVTHVSTSIRIPSRRKNVMLALLGFTDVC